MANKNIQIGGPVWPYFKYFYTRHEGWDLYWRPSPNNDVSREKGVKVLEKKD